MVKGEVSLTKIQSGTSRSHAKGQHRPFISQYACSIIIKIVQDFSIWIVWFRSLKISMTKRVSFPNDHSDSNLD